MIISWVLRGINLNNIREIGVLEKSSRIEKQTKEYQL